MISSPLGDSKVNVEGSAGACLGVIAFLAPPLGLKTTFTMLYPLSFALLLGLFTPAFLYDSTGFCGFAKVSAKPR